MSFNIKVLERFMENRINFIDYSKGIGILLVVLGHIYDGDNILANWIYSFYMPLFFIISGFLLNFEKETRVKKLFFKRFKTLIIPYIIFCIINIVGNFILNNMSMSLLKVDILNMNTLYGVYALWFLPALFISEFIFLFIKNNIVIRRNKILLYMLIFFSLLILILINKINVNYIVVKFITVLIRSIIALFFINIGYYSYKFINTMNPKIYQIIMLSIVSVSFALINGYVNLSGLIFNNYFLYIFNSVIGVANIIFIAKKIRRNKILSFFGKNTLIIMATHQLILRIIINSSIINYLNGVVLMFLMLIIEYPIIITINKNLAFLIGKTKDNKNIKNLSSTPI